MSLDRALQDFIKSVPECVAAGYVDVSTGMLLSAKTVDSHPQEVLDLVAAATADLFQGSNVKAIEELFDRSRGLKHDSDHHYFQEMLVFSDNLIHYFARGKEMNEHIVVAVCRKSANIGMVLAKGRIGVKKVEKSL